MSRLPVAAFVALAIATIAAFFIVQALKVTTPFVAGFPAPAPSAINPIDGRVCLRRDPQGQLVPTSFRRTRLSFYLLHRADNVNVYVVDSGGVIVRELPGSGVHMGIKRRHLFVWNGREDNGSVAPDGHYYFRITLVHQGRNYEVSNTAGTPLPVTVITMAPRPVVTGVTPSTITPGAGATVTIHYAGNEGQRPRILLYRVLASGAPRLVKNYAATSDTGDSIWNGEIRGAPAPAGSYLVGLRVTDQACNVGTFPSTLPPTPGSEPRAEIAVG